MGQPSSKTERSDPDMLIPELDCRYPSDNEESGGGNHPSDDGMEQADLIVPRKLPNPYLESSERKQLHKEMKLNQRLGVNVLNKKSELKKEFEKRQQREQRRLEEEDAKNKRTSFELQLERQANKLKLADEEDVEKQKLLEEDKPEFVKVQRRLKSVAEKSE